MSSMAREMPYVYYDLRNAQSLLSLEVAGVVEPGTREVVLVRRWLQALHINSLLICSHLRAPADLSSLLQM